MSVKSFLQSLLGWSQGQTMGTRFSTWRRGVQVGEDESGNVFYRSADGARRWVHYKGENDASRIAPEWHSWLHHTRALPPSQEPPHKRAWSKPHQPNMTGTEAAYRPAGSLARAAPAARQDYEAWRPE